MTNPTLAKTAPSGSRLYAHPVTGQEVPSVTTILGVLDKPALPRWAALEVATYAIENRESWQGLPARDALELLKKAPWAKSKSAADAGTDAHAYCEDLLLGRAADAPTDTTFAPLYGEAITNVRNLITELRTNHTFTVVAVEATAWNTTHGYAGTFDGLHLIDGKLTLVDLKTSKDVYPDYALQLAAYRYATHILLPDGTEIPMPQIDRCEIWHAPKEGTHKRVEVRADVDEFAAFTAALDIWKWKNHHAPNVIDKPKRRTKTTAA